MREGGQGRARSRGGKPAAKLENGCVVIAASRAHQHVEPVGDGGCRLRRRKQWNLAWRSPYVKTTSRRLACGHDYLETAA